MIDSTFNSFFPIFVRYRLLIYNNNNQKVMQPREPSEITEKPLTVLAHYPIPANPWYNISNKRLEMGFLDASYRKQAIISWKHSVSKDSRKSHA